MSIEALDWAFKLNREDMTSTMKLVLLVLADFAGDEDESYPRQNTISSRSMLTREAVNKNIKKLEAIGIIKQTGRTHPTGATRSSVYKLMIPDTAKRDPKDTDRGVNRDHTQGVNDNHPGANADHTRSDLGSLPGENEDHTFNLPIEPSTEPSTKSFVLPDGSDFPADDESFGFESFWKRYPIKTGSKKKSRQIWMNIVKAGKVKHADILHGLELYLNKDDFREWCMAQTWLFQERWEERPPQKKNNGAWGGVKGKRVTAI